MNPASYPRYQWTSEAALDPREFRCGYCDKTVGPDRGYYGTDPAGGPMVSIYLCSRCRQPTYFDATGQQFPGVPHGNPVDSVPDDIATLYDEARSSFSVGAYTASVQTCRKILMNIAVAQGAKEGESFVSYVEHLAAAGYVPPNGKGWVDHIRQKGNEANHEIRLMSREGAEELISFVEMLLKFIYEFPARVPAAAPSQS
jgi:Domain of unknown function (DUF4145)